MRFLNTRIFVFLFSIALIGCMPSEDITIDTQVIDGDKLPNQNIGQIIKMNSFLIYNHITRSRIVTMM